MCRTHDLAMQTQGHTSRSWDLPFNFISPEPFEQYSLNFTQMFRSVRRCSEPMTICVHQGHISRSWDLPVNFISTPYLLNPFRWCAEPLTQLRRIKVRFTLQGHGILRRGIQLSFRLRSCLISEFQSILLSNFIVGMKQCRS